MDLEQLKSICIVCLGELAAQDVGGTVDVEEGGESVRCLICRPCFYPQDRASEYAKMFAPAKNLKSFRNPSSIPGS